jgi:lactoylglutathione lyase
LQSDDLDAMHRELKARGGNPGEFGIDEWGGRQYRTFFLREDENGYCYCFYHPA